MDLINYLCIIKNIVLTIFPINSIFNNLYYQLFYLFHRLIWLTNLNFSRSLLQKLPEDIGNLTNLQKLNLKSTTICELPESMSLLKVGC